MNSTDHDAARQVAFDAMVRIARQRGLRATIAAMIERKHQDVSKWTRVPLDHVFVVASILKQSPEQLRPDFFLKDPMRKNRAMAVIRSAWPVQPKIPNSPIPDSARLVWLDPAHSSNKAAADAVSVAVGRSVSVRALQNRFIGIGRRSGPKQQPSL